MGQVTFTIVGQVTLYFPVGEPDKHYIVLFQIFNMCGQCRTGVFVRLLFGSIDQGLMQTRISMYGLYLEKVAAGSLTDDCGHIFGIALQFAVRYQPAGTGRGIHAIGFRNGEVTFPPERETVVAVCCPVAAASGTSALSLAAKAQRTITHRATASVPPIKYLFFMIVIFLLIND